MENVKVLVVDDEKNILESVKMVLDYEKYTVAVAKDGICLLYTSDAADE